VNEKKIVEYTPPEPRQVKKLMVDLIQWSQNKAQLNPVVVSAIFHHQFVSIHPFLDGNGRTARIVALWLLYQNGFDTKHYLAVDEYFADNRKKYYQKIMQTRELDCDFTYWIEYVAEAIQFSLEAVHQKILALNVSAENTLRLTPKQQALVEFINRKGSASSSDLQKALKINRARVNALMQPLLAAGIIKTEGRARAVRYFIQRVLL
jgi:Fic family protein